MRERIYDIAFKVDNNPVMEQWRFSDKELKLFAKLIVDESIDVAWRSKDLPYAQFAAALHEHFGV